MLRTGPNKTLMQLSGKEMASLARFTRERLIHKGEVVYDENDAPDTLWLVKSGRVHVYKATVSGEEAMLAFYGPGENFCVAAVIIGKPYPCSARAAVDTVVVVIPASAFNRIFKAMPLIARRLLQDMAPQFCNAHCNCAMNVESVELRLARTLLRLDAQFEGHAIPFTRYELAQMVSTTVESCIRTLSLWSKNGLVEGSRGELHLVDRNAMQVLIDDDQTRH